MKRIILLLVTVSTLNGLAFSQNIRYENNGPLFEGYVNWESNRYWNNQTSAFMDSMIKSQQQLNQQSQQIIGQVIMAQATIRTVKEKSGKTKIAQGIATTKVQQNPNTSFINQLAKSDAERQSYQMLLDSFQDAASKSGLQKFDYADGKALAFVLSYLAYTGEDAGKQRLQSLAKKYRSELMKDALFQGELPDVKQQEYEKFAIQTMLACFYRKSSARNDLKTNQKESLVKTAQSVAEGVLKDFWEGPVNNIELTARGFGNKAERLVATGTGTTTFDRKPQSLLAGIFAQDVANQINQKDENYFTNLLGMFDKIVKGDGGQTNDLAFGNAVAFKIAYFVYSGQKVTLNKAQFDWVLKEMTSDILKTQGLTIQGWTEEQKQLAYEKLAMQSMDLMADLKKAQKMASSNTGDVFYDQSQKTQAVTILQNVKGNSKAVLDDIFSPRNLEDFRLTETGFVKIK